MELKEFLEERLGLRLKVKDHKSKTFQFVKVLVKILTFGKVNMEDYTVLIGDTFYARNAEMSESTVAHEMRHWVQKTNDKLFRIKYLFFPLPWGKTYRAKYEKEAYEISCFVRLLQNKHQNKSNLEIIRNRVVIDYINANFYGWGYFFMCWDLVGLKEKMYVTTNRYIKAIVTKDPAGLDDLEQALFDYYMVLT